MDIRKILASELQLKPTQIDSVLTLFAQGSTVPFVARYRKEATGGLEEDSLRLIEERNNYLNLLQERKETVVNSIVEQGKMTDELQRKIDECLKLQELEDLYLPYKPKRKTRGTIAKAKGLEPLALYIIDTRSGGEDLNTLAATYVNEELGVTTAAEALQGASDIIAEMVSESAEVRKMVREMLHESAILKSEKSEHSPAVNTENQKLKAKETKDVYRIYFEFSAEIKKIKPYQVLAINRGEKEKFLKVSFVFNEPALLSSVYETYFTQKPHAYKEFLDETVRDSFKRLIFPSVEREVRNELSETADLHAIELFAKNLRQLLLQPPIAGKMIMGIDPGFASGSKIAVIDPTGKYLDGDTIYPHPPRNKTDEAARRVTAFVRKYRVDVIAIGNGTASRETEQFIADLITKENLECKYIIVSEAGASVYSASELAKKEFPDLEASQRGNISIARRLLDPLAELVKIDPKSIGVGLYQHDVDQSLLVKKLDDVVVSCVNYVGVDLNTASAPLLTRVSGLNKRLAESIVKHRETEGAFASRMDLMSVKGIGEKVFEQCAGFLKVPGSDNPFDNTFIHPESYAAAENLLSMFKISSDTLKQSASMLDLLMMKTSPAKVAEQLMIGEPTLKDIIDNLKKPGRDPREDLPKPILRSDVLSLEDLTPGMQLKGTVRNVIDFGAFVDIGVKQDALLHISRMRNAYVKHPLDVVSVGDIIDVEIVEVDAERGRISISLLKKQ